MNQDPRLRDNLIATFGAERFTVRDLWRKFHRRSFFPTEEFIEEWKRDLARLSFIEPAPGPRGGEGWRVSPAVVESLRREHEAAAAKREKQNAPHRDKAAALKSRFATVRILEDERRVEVRYPDIRFHPRGLSPLRYVHSADIIRAWTSRHRYSGIKVSAWSLSCDWKDWPKLARAIDALDAELQRQVDKSISHYRKELERLVAIRDGHPVDEEDEELDEEVAGL